MPDAIQVVKQETASETGYFKGSIKEMTSEISPEWMRSVTRKKLIPCWICSFNLCALLSVLSHVDSEPL